ncbi:MAG: anti-sigma factor family protein [bacterium]
MSSDNNNICAEFNQDVWLFLSHELPTERDNLWQAHLKTCEDCRTNMQEIQETLKVYHALPLAEVDEAWFEQAITQALKPTPRTTLTLFTHKYRKIAAATLTLAAAILIFFVLPRQDKVSDVLGWEGLSVDTFITEIDSSFSDLGTTVSWSFVSDLSYENNIEDLDSQIDDLQDRLQDLAENLKNSM